MKKNLWSLLCLSVIYSCQPDPSTTHKITGYDPGNGGGNRVATAISPGQLYCQEAGRNCYLYLQEGDPEPKEAFEGKKQWEDRTATNYQSPLVIDINAADTTAWIALPGIGSRLASRIVNFRDRLGGFYSVEQVAETFGLRDSTFQQIKRFLRISGNSFRKININTATLEELKTHPYIRWQLANAIIAFRNEHGPFHSAEDIKQIMAITEDVYRKLLPYLNFDL